MLTVQKANLIVRIGPKVGEGEDVDIVGTIEEGRSMVGHTQMEKVTTAIGPRTLMQDSQIAIHTEAEEMAANQIKIGSATCADTMDIGAPRAQTGLRQRTSTEDPQQTWLKTGLRSLTGWVSLHVKKMRTLPCPPMRTKLPCMIAAALCI
jgi:hypothetical protein